MKNIGSWCFENRLSFLTFFMYAIFMALLLRFLYLQQEKLLEQASFAEVKQLITELQYEAQQSSLAEVKNSVSKLSQLPVIDIQVGKSQDDWPLFITNTYSLKRLTKNPIANRAVNLPKSSGVDLVRNIFIDGQIIYGWFSYQKLRSVPENDFPSSGFVFLKFDLSAIKSTIWQQLVSDNSTLFAGALGFLLLLILQSLRFKTNPEMLLSDNRNPTSVIPKSISENNERFVAFSAVMPDFGCVLDEDGYYIEVYSNDKMVYQKPDHLVGKRIVDILPAKPAERIMQTIHKTIATGKTQSVEFEIKVKQGLCFFEGRTGIMPTEPGEKRKVAWVSQDITSQKRIKHELLEREKRFRELFEHLPNIAVQGYSTERKVIYWNKASEKLYGYSKQEATGQLLEDLIIPEFMHDELKSAIADYVKKDIQMPGAELQLIHKDGSPVPVFSSHLKLHNIRGEVELYCIDIDLSESKKAQEKIEQLAYYDALTGLPNRRLFLDRLNQELIAEKRHKTFGAVLYLDLDNFKTLNDALGHDVGDDLLCQVGQRMIDQIREEDTVARLGGDEFVVLLKELGEDQDSAAKRAQKIAKKIQTALCHPYQLESHEHVITPSIGINVFPVTKETTPEFILKHADTAMYRAKKNGRNTSSFYHPDMQIAADQRLELEKDLRSAILNEEFKLYFQAQVNETGKIIGAEALLRWLHPQKGLVLPEDFIGVAEETGLIIQIGEWVAQTACQKLVSWREKGLGNDFHLAINVSSRQFHGSDFVEKIINAIGASNIAEKQLTLELTESVVIENFETTINKMQALQEKGVLFSIDDFGTGYSSLAYLKRLPINQLKIDRSFVRDIYQDANDEAIVETIISMAKSLGLQAIAEGVENEQQRNFLTAKGCSVFQGYCFSHPVPEDAFLALMGL